MNGIFISRHVACYGIFFALLSQFVYTSYYTHHPLPFTFHDRRFKMLDREQIEAYHRDGYLHVKQLFTPEETEELASEMVRVIN